MTDVVLIVAAVATVIGAGFSLLAAVGLVRFPDLYTRMHASAKAGVVGVGFILLSLAIVSGEIAVILRAVLAILFLILTTPISAHLLARAAYRSGLRPADITKSDDLKD